MERLGLFTEMGYTTIGDPYLHLSSKPFNESAGKGQQMVVSGAKSKTASQDGYFGKTFDRIMESEAYSDPVKLRRLDRHKEARKNLGKSWVPSSGSKKPSGVGSSYGTLSGPINAFSAANRPKDKYKAPGKNFMTTPGKMGTGYGYVGVTIGPTDKYSTEPYDRAKEIRKRERTDAKKKVKGGPFKLNSHASEYFDDKPYRSDKPLPPLRDPRAAKVKFNPFKPSSPAKLAAGCKAGTFDPYPKHSTDPYSMGKTEKKGEDKKLKGGVFRPSPCPKSRPTNSVMQQSITRRMNVSNYLTATATT